MPSRILFFSLRSRNRHGAGTTRACRRTVSITSVPQASPACSTVFGILDTGFMVGGAAPTMHQDLNKFGCGATLPATQPASGTTSTATERMCLERCPEPVPGRRSFAALRLAWAPRSASAPRRYGERGHRTEFLAARRNGFYRRCDFLRCATPRSHQSERRRHRQSMNGTDAESRKLDGKVWDFRQAYIVCGGNTGQGAGTIWSPGVAKNALTVGNVQDNTSNQVGELAGNSSFGPTGDGRMKPNLVATGSVVTSASAGTTNLYRHERLQHGDAACKWHRR